jgi:hypothetical protein
MPTIKVAGLDLQTPRHIGALGNAFMERYQLSVDASGKINGVDLGTGDTVILGYLPAGWELFPHDCTIGISDAFSAAVTGTIGFQYVDGVDSAAVPQDADYFLKSNALSAQAVLRGNNEVVTPVILPKDAYLVLVTGGTAHDASAARLDVTVRGVNRGV